MYEQLYPLQGDSGSGITDCERKDSCTSRLDCSDGELYQSAMDRAGSGGVVS